MASVAVDADPVKALMRADRDGLLRYHGFVSGDEYEVEVAGRSWNVRAADVADLVPRLRAVASLSAADASVRLVSVGLSGTFVLEMTGRTVELPGDHVVDWCGGFVAAASGVDQEHAGDDSHLDEIAELLDNPSLNDQCRMVVLGLMHHAGDRMSMTTLAERIGELPGVRSTPAKKTVVDALGFGAYLASDLAEQMIRVFGLRWSVSAGHVPCVEGASGEALPEMPGLARLRRLLAASRAGWLRYVGIPSPNKARWAKQYPLVVGAQGYVIEAERLDAWLDGVEAFHTRG